MISVKPINMEASNIIIEADKLFEERKSDELYDFLYKYKNEKNDEFLWRLARAAHLKYKHATAKEVKEEMIREARKYIEEALDLNDDNPDAHKWASIILVRASELQGVKAKVEQLLASRKHMMRAHDLNPNDPLTMYLLGVWCFRCADLSWTQRKLASLIISSLPTSSYEEALQYFEKAEEVQPNFYSKNLLMMGKVLLKIKKNEAAIDSLRRTRDYQSNSDDDIEAKQEAVALLVKLGIRN